MDADKPKPIKIFQLAAETVIMYPAGALACFVGFWLITAGDVAAGGVATALRDVAALAVVAGLLVALFLAAWLHPLRDGKASVARAYAAPFVVAGYALRQTFFFLVGLGIVGIGLGLVLLILGGLLGLLLFGWRQLFR